jgi:hypothetical protein
MLARSMRIHLSKIKHRNFSTISTKVLQNSIFMPEMYPAKLTVPVSEGNLFEFTVHNNEPIADFVTKVSNNCGSSLRSFALETAHTDVGAAPQTLGELKKHVFKMTVNGK